MKLYLLQQRELRHCACAFPGLGPGGPGHSCLLLGVSLHRGGLDLVPSVGVC